MVQRARARKYTILPNLSSERLLNKVLVAWGSLRGHTKSASNQMEVTKSINVGSQLRRRMIVNRSVRRARYMGDDTWSTVAHVANHLNCIPRPRQGPGQLANIIWPRCVRVVGVQPIDHPSLHNIRLLLFMRTASMFFFDELSLIEASEYSIDLHFKLLAKSTLSALNPPMIL